MGAGEEERVTLKFKNELPVLITKYSNMYCACLAGLLTTKLPLL